MEWRVARDKNVPGCKYGFSSHPESCHKGELKGRAPPMFDVMFGNNTLIFFKDT